MGGSSTTESNQGAVETKMSIPCCRGRVSACVLTEAIEGAAQMSSGRAFSTVGALKAKGITKLFDRVLSRWEKLWYNKEITNTLTIFGIIKLLYMDIQDIWRKVLGEKPVRRKLLKKCVCF